MEITEVRIKLMEDSDDRLQAFCSITFDHCFVVRDLKIIEGTNGPFVAMPSRKLTGHCPKCGSKNHLRASFCNNCGTRLKQERISRDSEGRVKLYADIAHPINTLCREMIQKRVIEEFKVELQRASVPGYVSRYDDDYDVDFESTDFVEQARSPAPAAAQEGSPATAAAQEDSPAGSDSDLTERRIQPPAREPRPPHTTPSHQSSRQKPRGDEFGQGIFDE